MKLFLSNINSLSWLSLLAISFFILSFSTTTYAVDITKTVNEETQLIGWKVSEKNFKLELIQRTPQQTRSFFLARGFNKTISNLIATHCVFQTIVRNTENDNSVDAIEVSLREWRIIPADGKNKAKPLKLKEVWNDEWNAEDVPTAARIAFRWATFPTEQTYQPGGDFNWGMISFGPKPNTRFDLHIFWKQGDQAHDAWIKNMQCPADII